jgi:hypothetical protein
MLKSVDHDSMSGEPIGTNYGLVITSGKLEIWPLACWLWSLIIFLIQRSFLSAVFIPHEVFTPQKYVHSSTRGSIEGGYPLCGV